MLDSAPISETPLPHTFAEFSSRRVFFKDLGRVVANANGPGWLYPTQHIVFDAGPTHWSGQRYWTETVESVRLGKSTLHARNDLRDIERIAYDYLVDDGRLPFPIGTE